MRPRARWLSARSASSKHLRREPDRLRGSGGGTASDPVGTVYIGYATEGFGRASALSSPDRTAVRRQASLAALRLALRINKWSPVSIVGPCSFGGWRRFSSYGCLWRFDRLAAHPSVPERLPCSISLNQTRHQRGPYLRRRHV